MPEKPKTQKDTLDQLWYAVIGANGDGLAGRVKRIEDRLNGKKPRRLEGLTIFLGILISLQTLGILDGLKAAIWDWFRPPAAVEAAAEPGRAP